MTTLTIDLSDSLAKEAKDAGLLDPSAIETLLRETLRHRAVNGLFEAADKLAAADFQPMTMDEIQEEVNAVRARRRRLHSNPSPNCWRERGTRTEKATARAASREPEA